MRFAVALLAAVTVVAIGSSAFASSASQREYKRGYDDCSKGQYDQNQHGASYKAGCRAAEDKMEARTECPPDVSQADRYKYPSCDAKQPGTQPARQAKISDLKGRSSVKVFDIMTSRGFRNVDTITSGNTIYGIYFNPATRQCVQVTNANNKVVDARDIGTSPNCH